MSVNEREGLIDHDLLIEGSNDAFPESKSDVQYEPIGFDTSFLQTAVNEDSALLPKEVTEFYEKQGEIVSSYKEMVALTVDDEPAAPTDVAENNKAVSLAINSSLACTFLLLTLKVFAAFWSGSVAVLASAIDSGLDVLSQGTLFATSRYIQRHDPIGYPIGKARLESLGVLIFAVVMNIAALMLFWESLTKFIAGLKSQPEDLNMDAFTISSLVLTIIIQTAMWYYCRNVFRRTNSSSAEALAQDHINDVCINLIGGIPALIAGYWPAAWFLDALGGMGLSTYIAVRWMKTSKEQLNLLIGRTAPPEFLNQLTFLACVSDSRIIAVDAVYAYQTGPRYQVELHIVLPATMSLKESHDIGEKLEKQIERLSEVEVAFVHADYETSHRPEHNRPFFH